MLLKRVMIENFGPFQGKHALDLTPSSPAESGRPVILIGGRNGSGKTSLLEAIRLCLHGRRALGNPRIGDYHNYLRSRVHRESHGNQRSQSSVRADIETVEVGHRHTYEVTRTWRNAANVNEQLQVKRDGEELQELFVDQYQAFLDELMPLGLAEFFFFDGERIQQLAEEDGSDRVVADSIRGLLGLDLTSRLQADMTILMRGRNGARSIGDLRAEAEGIESCLKGVRERVERLKADGSAAELRASNLDRAVKLQEQKIASEGGDFARRREELLAARYKWQASLDSYETELRELASGLLPFSLVPELCERVRQCVEAEAAERLEKVATAIWRTKQNELLSALNSPDFWVGIFGREPTNGIREPVAKAVFDLMERFAPDGRDLKPRPIHDLSDRDQRSLLAAIETALVDVPGQVVRLASTAEDAHERLLRVDQDLQRVPREEVLEPLLEDLSSLQTELAQVRQEQLNLEVELHRATSEQDELERSVKNLTERIYGLGEHGKAMALAATVRNVLQSYEQELTLARVEHLSECVTERYKLLAHKESLCSRAQFNPTTLALTLYDAQGSEVFRPLLSAGEKQVLAIAILWGLGLASGRQLPVIIDTPLGRLDTEHRSRLLSLYFPKASHQVVLLSTDSEIGEDELDVLRPSLARTLHLRFDSEDGRTTIEKGYLPVRDDC